MTDQPADKQSTSPDFATVLAGLNRANDSASNNLVQTFALLNERGANTLGVERANIWLFNNIERTSLRCVDQYLLSQDQHVPNEAIIDVASFPRYIAALKSERVIRADDAITDPRTSEFTGGEFDQHNVTSVLDAPILQDGEVVGVICLEHTGPQRQWRDQEASFVATLADFATIALLSQHKEQAESALIQAQKMESLGRLAGGIAHDFNNILTVISGAVDTLRLKLDSPQQTAHMIDLIADASRRGQKITSNLLAFGGHQELNFTNVSTTALLNHMSELVSSIIREDIEVTFNTGTTSYWVKADQNQLEQVLLSLILNSIDALPNGGHLQISVLNPDSQGFVGFAVTDNGCGIDSHTMDRIFDPFFTTKGHLGSGLGLSISLGIVQQHQGELSCVSGNDQGTRFELRLPRATALASAEVAHQDEESPPATSTRTILLVEDDLSVRGIVGQMLEVSGFRPLIADNAEHAIALAADNHVDLLVSDVVMPDRRGPDLYQDILKIKPELCALFVSGYSEEVVSEFSKGRNATGYLSKPFTLSQFRGAIEKVLVNTDG